ncbi:MAG: hypothetical protein WC178_02910 [Candidatus Paceibacterota bacterium]
MEEEKQTKIIYVNTDSEITEIVDLIKDVPQKIITLIIPKEAAIFQDITNLKILQKKSEEIGKKISISKTEEKNIQGKLVSGMDLQNITKKTQIPKMSSHITQRTKRVSDMVQKNETVDLRQISLEKEKKGKLAPLQNLKDEILIKTSHEDSFLQDNPISGYLDDSQKERNSVEIPKTVEEKEEFFWEDLSENKLIENEDRKEKVNELFDERGRLEPENDRVDDFDFAYTSNKKKRKKFSILPTISARFFTLFILICIFTASLSLFFILPKADVSVALKKEDVSGDFTFTANEDIYDIDVDAGQLPAIRTEISSEKTQTFTASSKKRVSEKASGEITILNECSTGAQVLVAGTRFLSKSDGKIFKIEETVTIPGFTKPEADTVPGQKVAKVVAAEAGETYNIEAGTFTIPAYQEKGDWRYSCLYARSDVAMAGGSDKEVTYISQAEYDKAGEALSTLVREENDIKVSEQKSEDLLFLNNTNEEGEVTITSSSKVDEIADSFEMTANIKKSVLSITRGDLESLLKTKVAKLNNFENAKEMDGSLLYEMGDIIEKDKQISFNISATESFVFNLEQDQIKEGVAGKNKEELNEYFAKMSGVKSVSVNLWPFWVNRVPENLDKINITLDIGDSV